MPLDFATIGVDQPAVDVSWTSDEAVIYALGVGVGQVDPLGELNLTTENTDWAPQSVVPTFPLALIQRNGLLRPPGDIDLRTVVHAEQGYEVLDTLPPAGSVALSRRVTGIYDTGRSAMVTSEVVGRDATTQAELFRSRSAAFVSGGGGFGGDRPPTSTWERPTQSPDVISTMSIRPDQALIYRLSGDRNPLHTDPRSAVRAGFSRPILHGLCTYAMAHRAIGSLLLNYEGRQIVRFACRFAKPVMAGTQLQILLWLEADGAKFQLLDSGGDAVLDRGTLTAK
jgi:acyl dehydratase